MFIILFLLFPKLFDTFLRSLLALFLADGKFQICNAEYLNIIRFGIRPTWNPEFNRIHFNLDDHFWHFSHVVENLNQKAEILRYFRVVWNLKVGWATKTDGVKNGLQGKLASCLSITVALFAFEVGSSGKQLFVFAFSVFTGAAGCIHSRNRSSALQLQIFCQMQLLHSSSTKQYWEAAKICFYWVMIKKENLENCSWRKSMKLAVRRCFFSSSRLIDALRNGLTK